MKRGVLIKPDGSVEPVVTGVNQRICDMLGADEDIVTDTRLPNMTFVYVEKYEDDPQPRNDLASSLLNTPIAGNVLVLGGFTEVEIGKGEIYGLTPEQADIFLSPSGEEILNQLATR